MVLPSGGLLWCAFLLFTIFVSWALYDQQREVESIRAKLDVIQLQFYANSAAGGKIEPKVNMETLARVNAETMSANTLAKSEAVAVPPEIARGALLLSPVQIDLPLASDGSGRPPQQEAFLAAVREAHLRSIQAIPPTPGVSAFPFDQKK